MNDPDAGKVAPLRTLRPDATTDGYCSSGAEISRCGKYRYHLWREWRSGSAAQWDMWADDDGSPIVDGAGHQLGTPKIVLFVMLNPSTADAKADDPTIRRCVGFAKAWGYNRLEVVNLFAWRATDPREVLNATGKGDPIGPENQECVERAVRDADLVICAWGAHGSHIDQDEAVLGWIEEADGEPHALALTAGGLPRHPLYLPGHLKPFKYMGRGAA